MKKSLMLVLCAVVALPLVLGSPQAFAKKDKSNPAGWLQGEKKGWKNGEVPPGLTDAEKKAKKEAGKAEKKARKKAEKADKEAKKKLKEAEKEAKKNALEADKEARKAAKEAAEKPQGLKEGAH